MVSNMKCFQSRPEKAFTLIELLVVIAIISLIVAILLPSLQKAKDLARTAVCQSNLKGQGLAFAMYGQDWGYIPRAGYNWADSGFSNTNWDGVLFPYLDIQPGDYKNRNTVFTCPADVIQRIVPVSDQAWRSYLINDVSIGGDCRYWAWDPWHYPLCPVGKKIEDIPRPAELILVTCQPTFGGYLGRNSWLCMSFYGENGQIPGGGNPPRYPYLQNHVGESTNFLWCDFHVDSLPWWLTVNSYLGGSANNVVHWYMD
jgi:prepilin-type N-terminal cleavage/methylation domain-containing protein/prepilin-type processing-associated H-X9-DG protein